MCQQFHLRYSGCGCELRLGPLTPCGFGPGDPRCHSILNTTRTSAQENCRFHSRFFQRQRPFTHTPQGFQLWAGGRHRDACWPVGKNPHYHPRSWDYFGEPEERRAGASSSSYNVMANPAAERRFGLWKQANFQEWTRNLYGAAWGGGGYEADDEAVRTKRRLRRAKNGDGKGGYWFNWRDTPESSIAGEEDDDGPRDDDWLESSGEEMPDVVPPRAPTLMWGCWDDRSVADESDEEVSDTDSESEDDLSIGSQYSEMEVEMDWS